MRWGCAKVVVATLERFGHIGRDLTGLACYGLPGRRMKDCTCCPCPLISCVWPLFKKSSRGRAS